MTMIGILIGLLLAPFFFMGLLVIVVGLRFKRNAGPEADQTAFWFNWIGFIWGWAAQAKSIARAFPSFQRDLTETFGFRPDDGRIT